MRRKRRTKLSVPSPRRPPAYDAVLNGVVGLLEQARRTSARAVNALMTATYWEIGRRIVEFEQGGEERAEYGERLLSRLSIDLTRQVGRGFSVDNLESMLRFFLAYPPIENSETASRELTVEGKGQTPSDQSRAMRNSETPSRKMPQREGDGDGKGKSLLKPNALNALSLRFRLPWSHYVRLLKVEEDARQFYESEALRGGWTVRQLDRQISTLFYERTLASRNKAAMLKKGAVANKEDLLTPEEEIKDPLVLEFLGLKDEYSEHELEEALIRELESFLLELGGDFAFVGRQRRLRVGDEWYRIDLLFFHRRLKCLVIIDLKLGAVSK